MKTHLQDIEYFVALQAAPGVLNGFKSIMSLHEIKVEKITLAASGGKQKVIYDSPYLEWRIYQKHVHTDHNGCP